MKDQECLNKISNITTKVYVLFNGLIRQFILYFTFINKYMLADIEKMYHKILIRTENRKFQRILHRSDQSEDIRIRYNHLHYRVLQEIGILCDKNYACRQEQINGKHSYCAKSKVTLFKSISFPELELCGVYYYFYNLLFLLLFTQLISQRLKSRLL